MQIPELAEPTTRQEVLRELQALHERSTEIWDGLPTEELFAPQGEKWTPAQHLEHLTRSNGPVGKALAMPKGLLLLRFGPALRSSRDFAGVVSIYHDMLAKGVKAVGSYRPGAPEPPENPEEGRRHMMERRERAADRLHRQIERWGDTALDRLRLPHPVLGKLTVREILYFTLYHNHHHVRRVVERRG